MVYCENYKYSQESLIVAVMFAQSVAEEVGFAAGYGGPQVFSTSSPTEERELLWKGSADAPLQASSNSCCPIPAEPRSV